MAKAVTFLLVGILALGLIAGMISFVLRSIRKAKGYLEGDTEQQTYVRPEGCCGRHAVCEHSESIKQGCGRIVYFDDEELDVYRGTPSDQYDEEAIAAFREVFETMYPSEVAQWLHSLRRREIDLPDVLHNEIYSLLCTQADIPVADIPLSTK